MIPGHLEAGDLSVSVHGHFCRDIPAKALGCPRIGTAPSSCSAAPVVSAGAAVVGASVGVWPPPQPAADNTRIPAIKPAIALLFLNLCLSSVFRL